MAGGQKTHRFTFCSWCSRAFAFDMASRNRRWNARGRGVGQRADRGPELPAPFTLCFAWPLLGPIGLFPVSGLGTCPTADLLKLKWPLPRQAASAVKTPMYQKKGRGAFSKAPILRKSPNVCISLELNTGTGLQWPSKWPPLDITGIQWSPLRMAPSYG